MGISETTFYNWKKKYGGLGSSELRRLRQLEAENQQPGKLLADLSLDKHMGYLVCLRRSDIVTPYRPNWVQ